MEDSEGYSIDELEKALQNIDVFCKALVKKIVEDEVENNIVVEPMENLLKRREIIEPLEPNPMEKTLIPLPQLDEPLIDVFEDENNVKVLMQCRCKDEAVTIHRKVDGLELCTRECRKLNLPIQQLRIENMVSKCNNNEVFEIDIPKTRTPE